MFFTKSKQPTIKKSVERISQPIDYATDEELIASIGEEVIFDCEVYSNYVLATLMLSKSHKVVCFEYSPDERPDLRKLNWCLWAFCLIGFNSRNYDVPIAVLLAAGFDTETIKKASDQIIVEGFRPNDIEKEYGVRMPPINHIDIQEVAPLSDSLKTYAARMHIQRLQELPYSPNERLSKEQAEAIKQYNIFGDCIATERLYKELLPQISLREAIGKEYGLDLRSKSDAQIAEVVIGSELKKLSNKKTKRPELPFDYTFKYEAPSFITFNSPNLNKVFVDICNSVFYLDANGRPKNSVLEDASVKVGDCTYTMGIGGLHSNESCVTHYADNSVCLLDRDVASFYPRIILNNSFYPSHLGEQFLIVYNSLVERRLTAKVNKDKVTSDSIKITINGCFGKLGDKYSIFYSPDLLVHVTITGQLCLLMLIEAIELAGIPVVSANTDGIVIKCPRQDRERLNAIVGNWERATNFETEETEYLSLHSRDVNSYLAVKTDGSIKTKGAYSERGSAGDSRLSKNPEALICADAVKEFIINKTPVEHTIKQCSNLERFIIVRKAKGGAHKNGTYLGKTVRWYFAHNEAGAIHYVGSGNMVANSEGGKPCMDLPEDFPSDIDHSKYISRAYEMLYETGTLIKPGTLF